MPTQRFQVHRRRKGWEFKVQILRHKDLGSEPGPASAIQFQNLEQDPSSLIETLVSSELIHLFV